MDPIYKKAIGEVMDAVSQDKVYRAEKYLSDKVVVRATRKRFDGKLAPKGSNFEAVLVVGRPNFAEREFIRICKKAKEPFPVKRVQLKFIKSVKK